MNHTGATHASATHPTVTGATGPWPPLPELEQLPNDLGTLKGMILELLVTLRERDQDLQEARQRVDLLLRRLYGPRSERYHPDQPLLFADAVADAVAAAGVTPSGPSPEPAPPVPPVRPRRRCRPHGRRPLPENLPRRRVHHELTEAERLCVCGHRRIDIGTEVSEQLDWQPACYFVWQHCIHKYLCPACTQPPAAASAASPAATPMSVEPTAPVPNPSAPAQATPVTAVTAPETLAAVGPTIVSARKPAMPIAKGLPGPGLLAQIIVSKYADHLPLYRQEGISQRQGVLIPRSTSCDWMAASAELLGPLYEHLVAAVLHSRWLHTDDTIVKNQGHEPGTTDKARLWLYYGDRDHPYNVFDFTVNRQRDGPETFLANFHGYLHADAFSGYDALYLPRPRAGTPAIVEVACNAHARRKFYEARTSDAARSHQALGYYRQLYELERAANVNQFDEEQRRQLRRDFSVLILENFHQWLEQERAAVLPKSPIAEAIGYALHNWTALCRYTEAGFLAIDNNVAEREMKRIAIGRKNWLFVGSAKGGRTAAVLFSFTSTCHRLGVEPWAYLQDVLTRLPQTPTSGLVDLLPDRWQAARAPKAPAPAEAAAPAAPVGDATP
jgi:transposase